MTEGTDSRIGYLADDTTNSSGSIDLDGDVRTFNADDVTLTVDDSDVEPVSRRGILDAADQEVEFSLDIELDLEQTVTCRHCGEVNGVPDAMFLTLFDMDPPCRQCGFPLGVIR